MGNDEFKKKKKSLFTGTDTHNSYTKVRQMKSVVLKKLKITVIPEQKKMLY